MNYEFGIRRKRKTFHHLERAREEEESQGSRGSQGNFITFHSLNQATHLTITSIAQSSLITLIESGNFESE